MRPFKNSAEFRQETGFWIGDEIEIICLETNKSFLGLITGFDYGGVSLEKCVLIGGVAFTFETLFEKYAYYAHRMRNYFAKDSTPIPFRQRKIRFQTEKQYEDLNRNPYVVLNKFRSFQDDKVYVVLKDKFEKILVKEVKEDQDVEFVDLEDGILKANFEIYLN